MIGIKIDKGGKNNKWYTISASSSFMQVRKIDGNMEKFNIMWQVLSWGKGQVLEGLIGDELTLLQIGE